MRRENDSKEETGSLSCPFATIGQVCLSKPLGFVSRRRDSLLKSIGDAAAREVVRRHLYADSIADQDAYAMLAHLARNRRQHHVSAVVELHFEERIGLFVDYRALCWN